MDDSEVKNGRMDNGEMHNHTQNVVTVARLFPSARMTISIMMFFACFMTYILRLNIGFAMVCMIKSSPDNYNTSMSAMNTTLLNHSIADGNHTIQLSEDDSCSSGNYHKKHTTSEMVGEFEWEKSLQGALLGAFFYGYIVTQVPAGWLCDRIGGKVVLITGLGIVSAINLALPEAARLSPYAMLAIRVLQGMFGAVSFPAIHNLVGSWAPPNELGLLMALSYSGMYVGTLVNFPLGGLLCNYGFAGGWPSIFYVTGIMGLVVVSLMVFLVYDGYEKHPRISAVESHYLEKTLVGHHVAGTHISIPWLKFMTSGPVWAIVIAHLCANWGLYTLVINLPLFMKEVLKFDIKQNGFLSALPYLCTLIVNLLCGKLTDFLRRREICSWTVLRKVFNSIGMFIPALCMLTITFLHCQQRYYAVAALTACQAISGFAYSGGFFYNHVDLSPQHAGILMGISNMFATIPGILAPLLVGILTPNGTREEWLVIFYIGTALYAFGAVVYLILGSGDRQEWSFTKEELKAQQELQHNPIVNSSESNGTSIKNESNL